MDGSKDHSTRENEPRLKDSLRTMRVLATIAVVGVLLGVSQAAAEPPDGSIMLSGGSMAVGVGITWANGTLYFQGKTYAVEASGLSVADLGATHLKATGMIYNLKNLGEFDGNYTAVVAGATVGRGASAGTMTNQNGVRINLVSTTAGLKFTLAAAGVSLKIKK